MSEEFQGPSISGSNASTVLVVALLIASFAFIMIVFIPECEFCEIIERVGENQRSLIESITLADAFQRLGEIVRETIP